MYQIFFLAVFLNALCGLILITGKNEKNAIKPVPGFILDIDYWNRPMPLVICGISSVLTGVLKLLSVTEGNIVFLGDLLPAAYAMFLGAVLLLRSSAIQGGKAEKVIKAPNPILAHTKIIGIGGIAVAIIHFFLHPVLFL